MKFKSFIKTLSEKTENPIDVSLKDNGWEEEGGIGLYSHPRYPNITVDTNTGNLWVIPVRENGPFNASDDDFLTVVHTYDEFKDWLKRNADWANPKPIDWNKRYMKTLAVNATVGSKIKFKDNKTKEIKTGTLVRVSNSHFAYVDLGDGKEHVLVHPTDIINIRHDYEKMEWFLEEGLGKTHVIRHDHIKPRGSPEETARAFDKKFVNRSMLKKLATTANKFYVVQGDVSFYDWSDEANDEIPEFGNYIMIQVMGGNTMTNQEYHGINVLLPLKDTKFELDAKQAASFDDFVTGDPTAERQAKKYKKEILKAALDALEADKVPGIYSGLGGHEYKIAGDVGGIAEFKRAAGIS